MRLTFAAARCGGEGQTCPERPLLSDLRRRRSGLALFHHSCLVFSELRQAVKIATTAAPSLDPAAAWPTPQARRGAEGSSTGSNWENSPCVRAPRSPIDFPFLHPSVTEIQLHGGCKGGRSQNPSAPLGATGSDVNRRLVQICQPGCLRPFICPLHLFIFKATCFKTRSKERAGDHLLGRRAQAWGCGLRHPAHR